MISTILLQQDCKTFRHVLDPDEISALRQLPGHVLWVEVNQPTPQDFACLQEEFGFHRLAIEDCRNAHQRPKIEDYHGYYFIVLYEPELTERGELILRELAMFFGANYVVTVHHGPIQAIARSEQLWRDWADIAEHGAGLLAYLIIDAVVDEFFPILDTVSDRIDSLEDWLFEDRPVETTADILEIKKQLLLLRRSVTPLRDVFNILLRREQALFSREVAYYFHDIYDHLIRVADSIDNLRDLLGSTMDVYLSLQSNRMNVVMKRLTALSTILMSAALISGIYGMNFQHMPELAWTYGYYAALVGMIVIVLALALFFRWIKWL